MRAADIIQALQAHLTSASCPGCAPGRISLNPGLVRGHRPSSGPFWLGRWHGWAPGGMALLLGLVTAGGMAAALLAGAAGEDRHACRAGDWPAAALLIIGLLSGKLRVGEGGRAIIQVIADGNGQASRSSWQGRRCVSSMGRHQRRRRQAPTFGGAGWLTGPDAPPPSRAARHEPREEGVHRACLLSPTCVRPLAAGQRAAPLFLQRPARPYRQIWASDSTVT